MFKLSDYHNEVTWGKKKKDELKLLRGRLFSEYQHPEASGYLWKRFVNGFMYFRNKVTVLSKAEVSKPLPCGPKRSGLK